jgi:DNA-binding transcriptional MerR regulator
MASIPPVAAIAPVPTDNSIAPPALRIGQVAQSSGLPVKTIRFYCDQGLISPRGRSQGGYRLFDHSIYTDLALIRSLRALDVPLCELRSILDVRRSGVCNCSVLKTSIQSKLAGIEQRIKELDQMRLELAELLKQWQDCGGAKPAERA